MFQRRIFTILVIISISCFIIVVRLFSMQVIDNSYYRTQSRKYATRIELIAEPRGKILDRNGNILATNKLSFDLFFTPYRFFRAKPAERPATATNIRASLSEINYLDDPSSAQSLIVKELATLLSVPETPTGRPTGKAKENELVSRIKVIYERILSRSATKSERDRRSYIRQQYYNRYRVFSGLTLEQALQIETRPEIFTGFSVSEKVSRQYLYNELASHIIGYIGPIWQEEYDKFIEKGYFYEMLNPAVDENTYQALIDLGEFKDEFLGRIGIERQFNRLLSGKYGVRLSEYDYATREKRELSRIESITTLDIQLTIDLALQKKVEESLRGKTGAAIVMDIHNGEILAIASAPSFNPNLLQPPVDKQTTEYITKSPSKPLYNRAIAGEYPPGSVFKIITAIAALEEGKIKPNTTFYCNGYFSPSYKKFKCWIVEHNREHGSYAIEEGFKHSCNIFFYNAGKLAGADALINWAGKMGLGKRTDIDIAGDKRGLIPEQSELSRLSGTDGEKRGKWSLSETLNISIGQGDLMVTPLQIVRMMSAVANGGKLVKPRLIKTDLAHNIQHEQPKISVPAAPKGEPRPEGREADPRERVRTAS
ncbi:MAG: penicillin-binding transpeptidase domain-containing protein, partial [Planctomycetota bacterium]|nr:penicillin-binding transpeptidase domain-containing protein [Planctomycetota bacterium]